MKWNIEKHLNRRLGYQNQATLNGAFYFERRNKNRYALFCSVYPLDWNRKKVSYKKAGYANSGSPILEQFEIIMDKKILKKLLKQMNKQNSEDKK